MTAIAPQVTLPPGPARDEILRALQSEGAREIPEFLLDVTRRYGAFSSLDLAHKRYYLINDPDAIRDVLVTHARSFRKGRGTDAVHELLGNGIFSAEPPAHTTSRRMLQPAFHREHIENYATVMLAHAERTSLHLRSLQTVDIGREMRAHALRVGCDTLFSQAFEDGDDLIGTALTTVMESAAVGIFGRLHDRPTIERRQRFRSACARLHAIADGIISHRRALSGETPRDLLGLLFGARDEDGKPMADAHLRDEVLTMLLAAQESTALALTWTCWLLATHPRAQERLHQELDATQRQPWNAQTIRQLPYAAAVFKEGLRLFPPAWLLARRAREAVTIAGLQLPRGAAVYISPYVMQRSERCYENPQEFRPERWLDAPAMPPFTYFPFGSGARGCIGEAFAWMEGIITLATVARSTVLRARDATPLDLAPLLTLRPARPVLLEAHSR
ncbi:MAG TPA: cytochrome P450 [Candidatus Baltobacteraceae bacterium]